MPIYGDEKKREIARSVLPSTHRKGARTDLRNVKQSNRTMVKHQLGLLNKGLTSSDVIDNFEEASFDFGYYPDAKINDIKWERRNGDKLGALLRWAPAQVSNIRLRDRTSYMYSIMPDTVIGRHAVGHVDYLEEFMVPNESGYIWIYRSRNNKTDEEKAWIRAVEYAVLYERLYSIFEKGLLGRFNKNRFKTHNRIFVSKARFDDAAERERDELAKWKDENPFHVYRGFKSPYKSLGFSHRKTYYYVDTKDRPLRGVHDIDNFIKDVSSSSDSSGYKYYPGYGRSKGIIDEALEKLGV